MSRIHQLFPVLLIVFCVIAFVLFTTSSLQAADPSGQAAQESPQQIERFYVGTYTNGDSRGIYQFELDLSDASLRPLGLAAEVQNPTFLALHPEKPLLYAVGEIYSGGTVSGFRIEPKTGKLTAINAESSRGKGPCHVTVDQTGRCVMAANYGSGSVVCLPIDEQGKLLPATSFFQHKGSGPNTKRQQGPHAHCVNMTPDNKLVLANDLGTDKTMIYRLNPDDGELLPHDPAQLKMAPGAGPRHLDFHPNGRWFYVINELDSTITQVQYDTEKCSFRVIASVTTIPSDFTDNNQTAEVFVHPSGKYVYGSNRGHNSIAVFEVDADTGGLKLIEWESTQGDWPRNFAIDPSGQYLLVANQNGNNIVVLRIDQHSGQLTPTGQQVTIPSPVCILFDRSTMESK